MHGGRFALKRFRRHVGWGSCDFAFGGIRRSYRQAKVRNTGVTAAINHNVGGLQVTVNDLAGMSGGQSGAKFVGNLQGFLRGQTSDSIQQRGQVFTVHILHGQVRVAVDFADVVHPAHIGMGDLAGDADLCAEALDSAGILGKRRGQKFQSDRLTELEIVGAVHHAHAAASQNAKNAVAVHENYAGRKIQGVGLSAGIRRMGRERWRLSGSQRGYH